MTKAIALCSYKSGMSRLKYSRTAYWKQLLFQRKNYFYKGVFISFSHYYVITMQHSANKHFALHCPHFPFVTPPQLNFKLANKAVRRCHHHRKCKRKTQLASLTHATLSHAIPKPHRHKTRCLSHTTFTAPAPNTSSTTYTYHHNMTTNWELGAEHGTNTFKGEGHGPYETKTAVPHAIVVIALQQTKSKQETP